MKITLTGSDALYTVEQLLAMMLPSREGECAVRLKRQGARLYAAARISIGSVKTHGTARASLTGEKRRDVNLERRAVARAVYRAALPHLPEKPAWGMLSGVRPAKLVRSYLEAGGSLHGAVRFLEKEYFVSREKAELCGEAGKIAEDVQKSLSEGDISLYIHIPFCPSRCAYCSFISSAGDAFRRWGDEYMDTLFRELSMLENLRKAQGLRVRSVYIGGGTPVVYGADALKRLCSAVHSVCGAEIPEFTVEAGRPDAITAEKLTALREGGVTRVCVNPQTMQDRTLRAIGRAHTAEETRTALSLARDAGFGAVNCDLIAGLPGEDAEDFSHSLSDVLSFAPENVTVHTLARKHGSAFNEARLQPPPQDAVRAMLADARARLTDAGYRPYYLYRQKYTGGGFENIGWAKDGRICSYNVCMMEEIGDILSAGAGAVTKLTSRDFVRFTNHKYPAEYIKDAGDFSARLAALTHYYEA